MEISTCSERTRGRDEGAQPGLKLRGAGAEEAEGAEGAEGADGSGSFASCHYHRFIHIVTYID